MSNILHALTKLGCWRLDGEVGPMHRYYDRRLFPLPSPDEILRQYFETNKTFTGAAIYIRPLVVSESSDDEACKA